MLSSFSPSLESWISDFTAQRINFTAHPITQSAAAGKRHWKAAGEFKTELMFTASGPTISTCLQSVCARVCVCFQYWSNVINEFPAFCSLVVAPGRSLFGHRRQHLADVRGQEVVHLVALMEERRSIALWDVTHFCFSKALFSVWECILFRRVPRFDSANCFPVILKQL